MADERDGQDGPGLQQLAQLLQQLGNVVAPLAQHNALLAQQALNAQAAPPAAPVPTRVKGPTFTGTGDVEAFLRRFGDVANHQQWDAVTAFLMLRDGLLEDAAPCGEQADRAGVEAALRQRFGQTPEECRTALHRLRRKTNIGLAEHADQIRRLVTNGYPTLAIAAQQELMRENFRSSCNHTGLQQFLLGQRGADLDEMIRVGTEYLRQGQTGRETTVQTRQVTSETTDEPGEAAASVNALKKSGELTCREMLEAILQAQREGSSNSRRRTKGRKDGTPLTCWKCGQDGHVRRNCPQKGGSGNEEAPGK